MAKGCDWKIKIPICYASLDTDSNRITATELRGYLGYLFVGDPEFHHHSDNSFHYPLVQYKKVNKKLLVIGLNDYSNVIFDKISQLDSLETPDGKVNLFNVDLTTSIFEIKEEYSVYKFISPWLALNESNYKKFKSLDKNKTKGFLEKIIVSNVLSTLKGLGFRVDFQISAQINKFKPVQTEAHKNKFVGFYCEFALNVALPKFLGIGKSVSKGFGVIERIK
jgi:hypothetical protein